MELSGIGRSTAGAILALSANQPTAILDGNAKRVLCRFHQVIGHPAQSAVNKRLWQIAEQHTPTQSAAHYTQAIMDLGALICRRKPQCDLCPLAARCLALKHQQQQLLPTPAPKKKRPQKNRCFLLLHTRDQHVLLQKRPSHGIWGGLWSFPEQKNPDQTQNYCQQHWGCVAQSVQTWDNVPHQFSHFTLNITPLVVTIEAIPPLSPPETMHWHALDQVGSLGVPTPVSDLLGRLKKETS
jgi:A/G-specific adenine glycosylase